MANTQMAVGGAPVRADSAQGSGAKDGKPSPHFIGLGLSEGQNETLSRLGDHNQQLLGLCFANLASQPHYFSGTDAASGLSLTVGGKKLPAGHIPAVLERILDRAALDAGRAVEAETARSVSEGLLRRNDGSAAPFGFGQTRAALIADYCVVADTDFYGKEACRRYVAVCMHRLSTSLRVLAAHSGKKEDWSALGDLAPKGYAGIMRTGK